MPKTAGGEAESWKTKCQSLASRNEKMAQYTLKSSKTPTNQHFTHRKAYHKKKSTIYTDKWRSYDGLVFDGYKHYRINHSKEYSDGKGNHINGIENFCPFAKQRLSKFHGLSRNNFYYHIKECEFRYNKKYDIMKILRKVINGLIV